MALRFDEVVRDGKGRCAIARDRIAPGTRVLRTQAVASLSVVACSWCFQTPDDSATAAAPAEDGGVPRAPSKPLRRCGGCKRLKYCSSKCQQLDWTRGHHARECSAFTDIPESVRDTALQTLLLVTRLTHQLYLSADASAAQDRTGVAQLRAHYEDHAASKLEQFRDMAQLVLGLLARFKLSADERACLSALSAADPSLEDRVVQLFCRVNCNAFTISSAACAPRGIGVFPHGALFNHSCAPNCVVSFDARHMNVRAIADVLPGDELTISYVELLESTTKRQQALRDSYFFDCTCERCIRATAAASLEDAYLDGHACRVASCREGVVAIPDGATAGSCRVCLTERCVSQKKELERECDVLQQQLQRASTTAAGADRTWYLLERLETLLLRDLALHPHNTRVATFWRELGTFLLTASPPPRLCGDRTSRSSDLPTTALAAFSREWRATEWILPALKLPPRGLLHFQLGKLELGRVQRQLAAASPRGARPDDGMERATEHLHHALSILSCAYGSENDLVRAVQAHLDELQWTIATRTDAHR